VPDPSPSQAVIGSGLKCLGENRPSRNRFPQGRLNFRPVQIGFERCLGSATALSLERPSPFCHPEAKPRDLRCAIRVPRSYLPTTSTNHHRILMETPTSPLSFRVSRGGPRNRRSLGFARDDKKERVVPRKEWLLNRGIFQNQFGQVWLNLAQDAVLG
jgi:hypothetical protein